MSKAEVDSTTPTTEPRAMMAALAAKVILAFHDSRSWRTPFRAFEAAKKPRPRLRVTLARGASSIFDIRATGQSKAMIVDSRRRLAARKAVYASPQLLPFKPSPVYAKQRCL